MDLYILIYLRELNATFKLKKKKKKINSKMVAGGHFDKVPLFHDQLSFII